MDHGESALRGRSWLVLVGLGLVAALGVGGYALLGLRRPEAPRAEVPARPAQGEPSDHGTRLYAQHCAACHGDAGDGEGPAARFLYPKPRNFGESLYRLVSTENRVPSDDDLMRVITRGMPGSAMISFAHLSEADRRALIGVVRALTRSGLTARIRQAAAASGDELDADELANRVAERTTPGETIRPPGDLPKATPESLARGKTSYLALCAPCHGATGKGDGVQEQRDDSGMPVRPRDITLGIFKGEPTAEQLYARILIGIPGSPMPGAKELKLTPNDVGDLINYVVALFDAKAPAKFEHHRREITVARAATALPADIAEEAWQAAQPTAIVVSPLWWRNFAPPEFEIRALHDGESLAVRLSWLDGTRDDRVGRPEDFEDMAAIQLFQGGPEPFIGMGSAKDAIDLWLWRASWQRPAGTSDSILDEYPFDTPVYKGLPKGKTGALPDFQTARAAGNLHAHGDPAQSASNLAARGFGSTSFRPKASQLVTARSEWKDGRWTVVLRRPLEVKPEDGLALKPGGRCSIAFAVWDGAARDRNGQKLISIWHDLKLE